MATQRVDVDTHSQIQPGVHGAVWESEEGATAVEYGIVAGATAVGLIVLGPWLAQAFVVFLNVVLDGVLGV